MKYKDVFKKEKRSNGKDLFQIHFYKEGLWWKSFEWSVYLYKHFMVDLLKDTKKTLNLLKSSTRQHSDGAIVTIGMPIESFDNFMPNITEFEILSDKEIVYDLSKHKDIVYEIKSYINVDNYSDILSEWKDKQDFTTKVKKSKCVIVTSQNSGTILSKPMGDWLVKEIMSYPIESKTMFENTQFLINIKERLLRYNEQDYK